mgnify:CR=1
MMVKEIMNSILSLDKDNILSEALTLMHKHKLTHILVTEKGKIVGYCSDLDIAERLGSNRLGSISTTSIHMSTVMESCASFIDPDTKVEDAANIMIREDKTLYPVGSENGVDGFITMHDFAKVGVDVNDVPIGEIYSVIGSAVRGDDRLVNVRNSLIQNNIVNTAVVLEGSSVTGLIDIRMIAKSLASFRETVPGKYHDARIRTLLVFDSMMRDPPTLKPGSSIAEASNIFLQKQLYGIPVVEKGKLMGVLHIANLVKWIQTDYNR